MFEVYVQPLKNPRREGTRRGFTLSQEEESQRGRKKARENPILHYIAEA
jgi:hypothetical protein